MPRAMWSGAISFGLVNVPVKLFPAARSKDIGFNQLHEADGSRIQMKRVCALDGAEVPFAEIVKGYEVSPDRYVVITPQELEAIAPEITRGIDIEEFIDLAEIDPVYFENSYYLVPDKGGAKAYALLLAAMRNAGKVAIGRMVLRSKQYLVALRPAGDALSLSTLYFADEVVSQEDLDGLPRERKDFDKRELAMAQQLIEALSAPFEPEKFHDEYRTQVLDLIERKAEGEPIVIKPDTAPAAKVVDLMAALEASIAAAKGGAGGKQTPRGSAEKEPVAAGSAKRATSHRAAGQVSDEEAPKSAPAASKTSAARTGARAKAAAAEKVTPAKASRAKAGESAAAKTHATKPAAAAKPAEAPKPRSRAKKAS